MKVSIQKLVQKLTPVVFEKDQLEYREMSELKSLWPFLAYQVPMPMQR